MAGNRVVVNAGTREESGRKFVLCLRRIRGEIIARASERLIGANGAGD